MAANRKKGKKSQNTSQSKPKNSNAKAADPAPVSDNAPAAGTTSGDVNADRQSAVESTSVSGSDSEVSTSSNRPVSVSVDPDPIASVDQESESTTTESTGEKTVVADGTSTTTDSPADSEPDAAVKETDPPEAVAVGTTSETVAVEQPSDVSKVKLSTKTEDAKEPPAQEPPAAVASESKESKDTNFGRDEIRTLLVPVSPFSRLIASIIVIITFSITGFMVLKTPAGLNAQGMHEIDLAEAGDYVLIFKGDTQDAYGWGVDGRFRKSLKIDMEPIEPGQRVLKVEPIKDLSGAGFFTVAEFEVNQPGKYNLWIQWTDPSAKCVGKIQVEKDPVETFFFKWTLGIIGLIALFYAVGIPMTTRKAQSTLPGAVPPVAVSK